MRSEPWMEMERVQQEGPERSSPPNRWLVDRQGRRIRNLRVSVTDRCNFRCVYCMPEDGLRWLPREDLLSYEEIVRLVRFFVSLGIESVRITGGEPLVRQDLSALVALLASIDGIRDLSLTTNGVLLAEQARALSRAGLRRLNVSLDSLDRETFRRIARRDLFRKVVRGLEIAGRYLPGPIKVNTVLLRGLNDRELPAFAALARRYGYTVRFIEFMPLDADAFWSRDRLVQGEEVRERIAKLHPLVPDPDSQISSPSQDYVFADGAPGKIGFINSVTAPFCDHCNRIRLTADGKLRTCLFSTNETDLMTLLRAGSPPSVLEEVVRDAVWHKEPGHKINDVDFVPASRSMSQIGG